MDYYSITTSDVEWRAAICLCGMTSCRGSFLHYATQDDLQQVLNQNCGPLWRYATLLRSCSNIPLREDDYATIDRHGLKSAVFGSQPKNWILKYAAENLKFVEFERKALPCALMRRKDDSKDATASSSTATQYYTYSAADMDARSVMEQRIQSMVCSFSTINEVLRRQSGTEKQAHHPVRVLSSAEAAEMIWKILETIPGLLSIYVLQLMNKASTSASKDKKAKASSTSSSSISSKENIQSNRVQSKSSNGSSKEKPAVERSQPTEDSEESNRKANEISAVATSIFNKLASKPSNLNLSIVRALCLEIQQEIVKLSSYSSSAARFDQLADILVLWGYTINFSSVQGYDLVQSDVVTVYARDLGNNIPRIKVFKPEPYSRRLLEAHGSLSTSLAAVVTDTNLNQIHSHASDDMTTSMTEIESAIDVEIDPSAMEIAAPSISTTTMDDSASVTEKAAQIEDAEDGEDTAILFAKTAAPSTKKARPSRKDLTTLAPDEPVLMASKSYEPLFIFWQLMDWYNAGTDERVQAPDILGCVELPLPCQCFGEASSPYGQKQREALIAHLRNEKSQLMSWPLLLKSSFSKITSNPNPLPIYGSPTLDAALGKVDSIMKVLNAFGVSSYNKTVDDLVDTSQFDNILPPEMPTQWVQCDEPSCRR
jgi:hypothetical protein